MRHSPAKAADKASAKGTELGLLHGVPITIKENVDYDDAHAAVQVVNGLTHIRGSV